MRERWFGATGRRVPEIALEGELDVDGALVLDSVATKALARARTTRAARRRPRRDGRRGEARARASRGGVRRSSRDPALLDLDLPELTYG